MALTDAMDRRMLNEQSLMKMSAAGQGSNAISSRNADGSYTLAGRMRSLNKLVRSGNKSKTQREMNNLVQHIQDPASSDYKPYYMGANVSADGDEAFTQGMEGDLRSMSEYVRSMVGKGYSDKDIVKGIGNGDYPYLRQADEEQRAGAAHRTTRPVGYLGGDTAYALISKTRKPSEDDDNFKALMRYCSDTGSSVPDGQSEASYDPESEYYNPYAHGSTYFGEGSEADAKLNTENAKYELGQLNEWADEMLAKGKSPEQIIAYLSTTAKGDNKNFLQQNFPTLYRMEMYRQSGSALELSEQVDFALPYFEAELRRKQNGDSSIESAIREKGESADPTLAAYNSGEIDREEFNRRMKEQSSEEAEVTETEKRAGIFDAYYKTHDPRYYGIVGTTTAGLVDLLNGFENPQGNAQAFYEAYPELFTRGNTSSQIGTANKEAGESILDFMQNPRNSAPGAILMNPSDPNAYKKNTDYIENNRLGEKFYQLIHNPMNDMVGTGALTMPEYARYLQEVQPLIDYADSQNSDVSSLYEAGDEYVVGEMNMLGDMLKNYQAGAEEAATGNKILMSGQYVDILDKVLGDTELSDDEAQMYQQVYQTDISDYREKDEGYASALDNLEGFANDYIAQNTDIGRTGDGYENGTVQSVAARAVTNQAALYVDSIMKLAAFLDVSFDDCLKYLDTDYEGLMRKAVETGVNDYNDACNSIYDAYRSLMDGHETDIYEGFEYNIEDAAKQKAIEAFGGDEDLSIEDNLAEYWGYEPGKMSVEQMYRDQFDYADDEAITEGNYEAHGMDESEYEAYKAYMDYETVLDYYGRESEITDENYKQYGMTLEEYEAYKNDKLDSQNLRVREMLSNYPKDKAGFEGTFAQSYMEETEKERDIRLKGEISGTGYEESYGDFKPWFNSTIGMGLEKGLKVHALGWQKTFYFMQRRDWEQVERSYRAQYSPQEMRNMFQGEIDRIKDPTLKEKYQSQLDGFNGDIYKFKFDVRTADIQDTVAQTESNIHLLDLYAKANLEEWKYALYNGEASAVNSLLLMTEALIAGKIAGPVAAEALGPLHNFTMMLGTFGVTEGWGEVGNAVMDETGNLNEALAKGSAYALFTAGVESMWDGVSKRILNGAGKIAADDAQHYTAHAVGEFLTGKGHPKLGNIVRRALQAGSNFIRKYPGEVLNEVAQEEFETIMQHVIQYGSLENLSIDELKEVAIDTFISTNIQSGASSIANIPATIGQRRAITKQSKAAGQYELAQLGAEEEVYQQTKKTVENMTDEEYVNYSDALATLRDVYNTENAVTRRAGELMQEPLRALDATASTELETLKQQKAEARAALDSAQQEAETTAQFRDELAAELNETETPTAEQSARYAQAHNIAKSAQEKADNANKAYQEVEANEAAYRQSIEQKSAAIVKDAEEQARTEIEAAKADAAYQISMEKQHELAALKDKHQQRVAQIMQDAEKTLVRDKNGEAFRDEDGNEIKVDDYYLSMAYLQFQLADEQAFDTYATALASDQSAVADMFRNTWENYKVSFSDMDKVKIDHEHKTITLPANVSLSTLVNDVVSEEIVRMAEQNTKDFEAYATSLVSNLYFGENGKNQLMADVEAIQKANPELGLEGAFRELILQMTKKYVLGDGVGKIDWYGRLRRSDRMLAANIDKWIMLSGRKLNKVYNPEASTGELRAASKKFDDARYWLRKAVKGTNVKDNAQAAANSEEAYSRTNSLLNALYLTDGEILTASEDELASELDADDEEVNSDVADEDTDEEYTYDKITKKYGITPVNVAEAGAEVSEGTAEEPTGDFSQNADFRKKVSDFAWNIDKNAPRANSDLSYDIKEFLTTAAKLNNIRRITNEYGDVLAYETDAETDRVLTDIAERIANGTEIRTYDDEAYDGIVNYLHNTRIYIPQDVKGEIDEFWKYYKSSENHLRRLTTKQGKGAIDLDRAYMELTEMYPGYFPPENEVGGQNLLLLLNEGVERMRSDLYTSLPRAYGMEGVIFTAAKGKEAILEKYFKLKDKYLGRPKYKRRPIFWKSIFEMSNAERAKAVDRVNKMTEKNRDKFAREVVIDGFGDLYTQAMSAKTKEEFTDDLWLKLSERFTEIANKAGQWGLKGVVPEHDKETGETVSDGVLLTIFNEIEAYYKSLPEAEEQQAQAETAAQEEAAPVEEAAPAETVAEEVAPEEAATEEAEAAPAAETVTEETAPEVNEQTETVQDEQAQESTDTTEQIIADAKETINEQAQEGEATPFTAVDENVKARWNSEVERLRGVFRFARGALNARAYRLMQGRFFGALNRTFMKFGRKEVQTPENISMLLANDVGAHVFENVEAANEDAETAVQPSNAVVDVGGGDAGMRMYNRLYSIGKTVEKQFKDFKQLKDFKLLNAKDFADFFYFYMVASDEGLAKYGILEDADRFTEAIKGTELGNAIGLRRDQMRAYIYALNTEQAVMSAARAYGSGMGRPTIGERWNLFRQRVVDANNAAKFIDRFAQEMTGQKTEANRIAAYRSPYRSKAWASWIDGDCTNIDGVSTGAKSLRDIAEEYNLTQDDYKFFDAYLMCWTCLDREDNGRPAFADENFIGRYSLSTIQAELGIHQNTTAGLTRQQCEAFMADMDAKTNDRYKKAALEWYKTWDAFMQNNVVNEGLISQEDYDTMHKANKHYAPLVRYENSFGLFRATGHSNKQVISPISQMYLMMEGYTLQAARNRRRQAFDDTFNKAGNMGMWAAKIETEGMSDDEKLKLLDRQNVIEVRRRDGSRVYYTISDKGVYDYLQNAGGTDAANSIQDSAVMRGLQRVTRFQSMMATGANLVFNLARNPIKDYQSSVVHGSWASNLLTGVPKWVETFIDVTAQTFFGKGSEIAKEYQNMGGFGYTKYGDKVQKVGELNQAVFGSSFPSKIGKFFVKALTWEDFAGIIETTSRMVEYKYGKNATGTAQGRGGIVAKGLYNISRLIGTKNAAVTQESKDKAFIESREVTTDFARSGNGTVISILKAAVPFANPTLQGIDRTVRMFTDKDERSNLARRMVKSILNNGVMGVATVMLSMGAFRSDPDDEDKEFAQNYLDLADNLKQTHFIFPWYTGTTREFWRLPISQDGFDNIVFEMFRKGTEMALSGEYDDFNTSSFYTDMFTTVVGAGLGQITDMRVSFMPFLDVAMNRNYYGDKIISDSQAKKSTAPTQQYTETTPEMFKWGAKAIDTLLSWIPGVRGTVFWEKASSPIVLQYLWEQYGGFLGKMVSRLTTPDAATGSVTLDSAWYGLVKSFRDPFTLDAEGSGDIQDMYDYVWKELNTISASRFQKTGNGNADPNLTEEELEEMDEYLRDNFTKRGSFGQQIENQISGNWSNYYTIRDTPINKALSEEEAASLSAATGREYKAGDTITRDDRDLMLEDCQKKNRELQKEFIDFYNSYFAPTYMGGKTVGRMASILADLSSASAEAPSDSYLSPEVEAQIEAAAEQAAAGESYTEPASTVSGYTAPSYTATEDGTGSYVPSYRQTAGVQSAGVPSETGAETAISAEEVPGTEETGAGAAWSSVPYETVFANNVRAKNTGRGAATVGSGNINERSLEDVQRDIRVRDVTGRSIAQSWYNGDSDGISDANNRAIELLYGLRSGETDSKKIRQLILRDVYDRIGSISEGALNAEDAKYLSTLTGYNYTEGMNVGRDELNALQESYAGAVLRSAGVNTTAQQPTISEIVSTPQNTLVDVGKNDTSSEQGVYTTPSDMPSETPIVDVKNGAENAFRESLPKSAFEDYDNGEEYMKGAERVADENRTAKGKLSKKYYPNVDYSFKDGGNSYYVDEYEVKYPGVMEEYERVYMEMYRKQAKKLYTTDFWTKYDSGNEKTRELLLAQVYGVHSMARESAQRWFLEWIKTHPLY